MADKIRTQGNAAVKRRASQPKIQVPRNRPLQALPALALQRVINAPPSTSRPADILALQRAVGNRAVQRLLAAQAQHRTSEEEEEKPAQRKSVASYVPPSAQRKDKEPAEEEELQMKPLLQRRLEESSDPSEVHQENKTGLPDALKAGVEMLSGISMDDVRVHYNSSRPAEVHAWAYTQGTNIHVGPGQERHLPHEAWHVAQQKQGRVKPNLQLKGAAINDDAALENEADVMGQRSLSLQAASDFNEASVSAEHLHLGPPAEVIQPTWDTGETSDSDDHADGYSEEQIIDWGELTSQAQRLPGEVLFNIFYNMAEDYFRRADKKMPERHQFLQPFYQWFSGGVYTRARFKQLIGITPAIGDDTSRSIIQRARTGNTYSRNGGYQGNSNSHNYEEVIYYRDGGGNISFGTDPAGIVANFNSSESPAAVVSSNIKWKDPVDHKSRVQMNNDLTDKDKGVMPSGTSVNLPSASRAQHFAIADMLYTNNRSGTYTWHHLTQKYYMVLVDMKVHAKHGHNGGVHLW